MPDAGRTREPCVLNRLHIAHASNDRFSQNTGIPCAMVLTAYARALPGVPGLLAPVASQIVRET